MVISSGTTFINDGDITIESGGELRIKTGGKIVTNKGSITKESGGIFKHKGTSAGAALQGIYEDNSSKLTNQLGRGFNTAKKLTSRGQTSTKGNVKFIKAGGVGVGVSVDSSVNNSNISDEFNRALGGMMKAKEIELEFNVTKKQSLDTGFTSQFPARDSEPKASRLDVDVLTRHISKARNFIDASGDDSLSLIHI